MANLLHPMLGGRPRQTSANDEMKTEFCTSFGSAEAVRVAEHHALSRPKKLKAAYPKRVNRDMDVALNVY
jgi:hypothetical protein